MNAELLNIKAIIFDMDGLLIDSEPLYHEVELEIFRPFGINDVNYFNKFMGRKAEEVFKQIKEELKLKQGTRKLMKKRLVMMEDAFKNRLELMPYAVETLKKYSNDYLLALCSSSQKSLIDIVFAKFNLRDFFNIVVSGDDVKKSKPEPEIFLKAASLLKISPQEVLVLEDSLSGLKAAKRAGMYCIAIPNKYTAHCDFSAADYILKDLKQLQLATGNDRQR